MPELKIKKSTDISDPLDTARNITVKILNGSTEVKTSIVSGYMSMADLYASAHGVYGIPEYLESEQNRSWGYYFDEEMTKKVPYGFVPVKAETFYVGFADYSAVAGTYYVETTTYSDRASITLTADGIAQIRSGGLYYECAYTYNGKSNDNVIIYRSCLAALSYGEDEINGGYFAYGGTAGDGVLNLSAYLTLVDTSSESEYISYTYPTATLRAIKPYAGFAFGEYKNTNGVFYKFFNNGAGVRTAGTTSEAFTFAPAAADTYRITFAGGRTETVAVTGGTVDTINNVSVSKIDDFKGSWRKSANSSLIFTFDGEGGVTLGGTTVNYEVKNGAAGFTIGNVEYKATVNGGNLVINGENYFVSDSFTGEWYTLGGKEQIQIALGGLGTQGYGSAVISYTGNVSRTLDAEYDLFQTEGTTLLRIYVGDRQYGELTYNAEANSISGSFYSTLYGDYRSYDFDIYDIFRGLWTGVSDGFDTVTFNGRSATVGGAKVSVRTSGNLTREGTYALTDATTGTLTVGGVNYNIVYDEKLNKITFTEATEGGAANYLAHRDAWYGAVLHEGDTKYVFDGKSNLTGTVKVSDGTELNYTLVDGKVTLGGEELVAADNGFTWGDKTLTFKTGFAGEWYVSATDAAMVVGEVGGNLTADVSGVAYVYDPLAKTLTHTDGKNVTVLRLMGDGTEMNITRTINGVSSKASGIRTEKADSWRGVYAEEGDGSSWKLDGLGSGVYCSGTATYTPAGGTPVNYTYVIDELGNPYISSGGGLTMLEDEHGVLVNNANGGLRYNLLKVDSLYGRVAKISGSSDTYFFDGVSNVWVKSGENAAYTLSEYKYEAINSEYCEIIDGNGIRHKGRVTTEGKINRLTITLMEQYALDGVTYAFGWRTVWKVEGRTYTKAYTITVIDDDGTYTLTDNAGKRYTAVIKDGALKITEVEETTEQA